MNDDEARDWIERVATHFAWARVLRARFAGLTGFLDIARDGMELVGPGSARAGRVEAAHELYRWLADEVGPLWDRWDARP